MQRAYLRKPLRCSLLITKQRGRLCLYLSDILSCTLNGHARPRRARRENICEAGALRQRPEKTFPYHDLN
jgi:hypothetical protein